MDYTDRKFKKDPDTLFASNDPANGNRFGAFIDDYPTEHGSMAGVYFEAAAEGKPAQGAFVPVHAVLDLAESLTLYATKVLSGQDPRKGGLGNVERTNEVRFVPSV
jgi:hypothetical protein